MIFIDTSYLVAMAVREDGLHAAAMEWTQRVKGPFLTTDLVILEFVNTLSPPGLRQRAHLIVSWLVGNQSVLIESVGTGLFQEGLKLHRERPDKGWSLTDCVSFIVMQRHSATDSLTHDQHFEQAGFRALLRS